MMFASQSIPNPYGITVFGSSIIRVEPDTVVIRFSVTMSDSKTEKAFALAYDAVHKIQNYLRTFENIDVSVSRVTLRQNREYINGQHEYKGYQSNVAFSIILHDLKPLQFLLKGVIEAGANRIDSIDFQTTRLKELRTEARRQAMLAAIEKAQVYCSAAGKTLGEIIHIEDVNPDNLRGQEGHLHREVQSEGDTELLPFSSDSIAVNGAVRVAFKFAD